MRSTPSPNVRPTPPLEDRGTRERLLESAARTIADRGFRAATVREICRRAGANGAAVNYHFGSKEALEVEAVRWTMSQMPDDEVFEPRAADAPPPTLHEAVTAIGRCILTAREEWQTRLLLRAMAESMPSLDAVVREFIEPRVRVLEDAIRPLAPGADGRTLRLHALSVVSQLSYHRLAGPIALRLLGERSYSPALLEEITSHIATFTERALSAGRRGGRG